MGVGVGFCVALEPLLHALSAMLNASDKPAATALIVLERR
jgi:hypothetical protein